MGVDSELLDIPAEGNRDQPLQCRIENQPGELAHLDDVCAQRGVNHQLAGAVSGARDHPCSAPATTPPYAPPWRAPAWSSPSALPCRARAQTNPAKRPKVGRKLADAGVNIEGLREVSICQGEVIFAIAVDKPDEARAALSDQIVG